MLFSSLEFLYLFLPLTVAVYFLGPLRWRNGVLLVFSLLFYGAGEPVYLWLMVLTILADYGFGLWIETAARRGRAAKPILVLAIALHVSLLGFFKYYDWLASLLSLPVLGIPLPIGISFYLFQAMSYVIDVYRREVTAQRSLVAFGTYVSLFPQLVAGPIVRYGEIDAALRERPHTVSRFASGIVTFSVGLAKKVLLANEAGALASSLSASGADATVAGLWLWLILFSFQIYFDFSGYSDMAMGLGRLFGFDFPENFRYPYVSRSITEFWRRWHMTLSGWFRTYVYIPLGGNRRGRARTVLHLLLTWSLTGLWHGASPNFLLWGLYFFFLLTLEKNILSSVLEKLPRVLRHAYALVLILLGWLIFSADALPLGSIPLLAGRLVGIGAAGGSSPLVTYELCRHLPLLFCLALGSTPLPRRWWLLASRRYPRVGAAARILACLASLAGCTVTLVNSGYNPFLYFRF